MRIAIDCRYIRERPSGIGTYVRALVDRVPSLAPGDTFLLWAHPRAPRPLSTAPNVRIVTVASTPNSPLTIWWPYRFAPLDGVDLLHCPANVLPRGVRCATVVTIQDLLALDAPGLHRRGLERLVKSVFFPQAVWRALRDATRIIVPSRATADRVRAFAPDAVGRLRVIHDAPDPAFRPPDDPEAAASRARDLAGDAPYLLVVGEHSPTKRHDLAIAAFVQAAPPTWRLVLVQRLGERAPLRRLARALGVADRVRWLRNVADDDMVALMQSAEALLQPSTYEGFGLPVVEAMACGCPVIASDIPVVREVAAEAAALAPEGDTAAFAGAIRELVASPAKRRELVAAGLSRVRQFSLDRMARETLDVYREAMAATSSGCRTA